MNVGGVRIKSIIKVDGSVAVMHTNDIHGSYKYSYNESKGTGTVGFDGLAL